MGFVRRKPVRLATLQSQLEPHQSLIEYVLDEKGSYAIEMNRAALRIYPLPARSQIGKLSRSFVTAIRSGADSAASGQELYKQLIEPIVPAKPLRSSSCRTDRCT